ncbi:MAG TPA: hypothetical protein VGQ44_01535 [Gemmatimonadaceae bacterium]|jgi:hypothetical protein|nr:hypothetical protein [Gemmatimonadaceae bacterium]
METPASTPPHLPTLFQRPDRVADPLYVLLPVSNSARYRTRWKLYEDAVKMCTEAGAIPYTVEVAFGHRAFAITQADNPQHVQLRTSHEFWFKEHACNLGARHLPPTAKYLAYIDTDTRFARDDWANETVQRLQHYACVQMWSEYHLLDADYHLIGSSPSLMASYLHGWPRNTPHVGTTYPYPRAGKVPWPGPPGLAWAWRKDAWDAVGGLLDVCILGSADTYMAFGLLARLTDDLVSPTFSPGYRRAIYRWQERAAVLLRNVGVVPGLALHYWHGSMKSRGYSTRNQILIANQFDPHEDLMRDHQGLYQLRVRDARTIAIRDGCREYLASRNEDQV